MSILDQFDQLFEKDRDKLNELFTSKHKGMSATSKVFYKSITDYRRRGWHTHAAIWNVAFFLNMAAHDISVLAFQLASEHEPWTRKIAARHLALAAYETVEDMTQLLGKSIRVPLQELHLLDVFEPSLREIRKPLDDYWRTYGRVLKDIRVGSAAHRNHDSVALFELIDKIDVQYIMKLGLQLGDVQNRLGPHLQQILNRIAVTPPLET